MEPILPSPTSHEAAPSRESSTPPTGGTVQETGHAAAPERHESMSQGAAPPMPTLPPVQPVAPVTQSPPLAQSSQPVSNDPPVVADDVDVIEKEWVDKAKQIVSATKEDPYQQEKEVSRLQADYLMKRYNKQIKLAE